ncbi:MAG: MBL fold metallo-hydrolase [Dehalococcoidia bacterium]|nr:MAG: MBL fold metallo-hydrolase [Dehalococcoidia bacterium]
MILEALTVGFIATNCYIVASDIAKRGMVIDPGAEAKLILKEIEKLKLEISIIVVTHSHFDHLGAVKPLVDATGAKFAVGGGTKKTLPGAFSKMVSAMASGSIKSAEPDMILTDGDMIDIDDLHFKVLFTPGHCADEISLYGEGVLFSGDTLFNSGIGRTDFPGCSYEQLEESIKKKFYTLPEETIVYPGHGPATTIGDEKRGNPFIR